METPNNIMEDTMPLSFIVAAAITKDYFMENIMFLYTLSYI